MWPWGHLAVAYLAIRSIHMARAGNRPSGHEVWLLSLGALLPDLVDKTFSWTIPLLDSGRSLTHSFLTILVVGLLFHWLLTTPVQRTRAGAFFVGWVSHPIADAIPGLLHGDIETIFFWNWPFSPAPVYTTDPSYIAHFSELGGDLVHISNGHFGAAGFVAYEILLVAFTLVFWIRDGSPGWKLLRQGVSRVFSRTIGNYAPKI